MATGNFLNINANQVFAVEIAEEWELEGLKLNIQSDLESKKDVAFDTISFVDEWENLNRSYCGKIIAKVTTKDKVYNDFNCYLKFNVVIRNGYYSGVNIDWDAQVVVDEEDYDFEDDIYLGDSKKEQYYADLVQNWKEKEIEKAVANLEEVFKNNSMSLNVVGRFSNGEVIYEKA